ncbi:hypothetical protein [Nitrospira moscoviensis]|uniref:Uncharacterized protein n=1 Tax=Nitrospira moscoviensis TaxID=42253 RepID=A0A0K2GK96_NITMO|nr:hypothetical protein [Nitrospira moscoviensis]ALA61027.1 conserved exported protein of unknown function [Nitrospira moscoviensis]
MEMDRRRRIGVLAGSAMLAALWLLTGQAHGAESVPWECSTYSPEAQTRCMQAMIESQREKIGQLEGRIQSQQSQIGELRSQLDRESRAAADLQRQLTDRPPSIAPAPVPYPSPYLYAAPPGIGLGLYFGRPWIYGGPYLYGPPYWGPRWHGHWRHRW